MSVFQDVRFGWRVILKDRASMGAAAFSLALALGACVTAFSLVDALLLRPLPVAHADQLFYLAWPDREMRTPPGMPKEHDGFSYPLFRRLEASAGSSLDLFGANWPAPMNPVIIDNATGEREFVHVAAISGKGFALLGIRPAAGRLLDERDDAESTAHPVAVISYAFWKNRFGGDPAAIGKRIGMGDRQFEIAGVVENRFAGLQPGYLNDVWIPLRAMYDARTLAAPDNQWIGIWGRAKPGSEAAQERLRAAFTSFRGDYAAQMLPRGATAARLAEFVRAPLILHAAPSGAASLFRLQFARPLVIFGLFSGLLLLIAASNVANLFIARAVVREREMALRLAIGAGRGRLIRQLLVESSLVAAAACAGAIAIGTAAAPFLARQIGASNFPAWLDVSPDWRLLGFLLLAGVLTVLLFGMLPAFRASSVSPDEALKASAKHSGSVRALRPLAPVQVAFSFAVLFLSGLLLISFGKLTHVDLGFAKDRVILFTVNTRAMSPARQRQLVTELPRRLDRMSGVQEAAVSQQGLIGGAFAFVMNPSIRFPGRAAEETRPSLLPVSPRFFETMQIRMLAGRGFQPVDVDNEKSGAAIVNEAFVRQFFPAGEAIGQRFERTGDEGPTEQEIVGVVSNSLFNNLRETVQPSIYVPLRNLNGATVEVRTAADPRGLAGALRREIENADAALRVRTSILQSERIDDTLISERLLAWIAGFFAAAAIVLAAVGLNGVIGYFVARRTREIGIRMALGAESPAVVRFVVRDAVVLICIGIIAGAAGGLALSRYVNSLLFEVQRTDFVSLAAPIAGLLLGGAAAALRPAIRAARIDPVIALRYE